MVGPASVGHGHRPMSGRPGRGAAPPMRGRPDSPRGAGGWVRLGRTMALMVDRDDHRRVARALEPVQAEPAPRAGHALVPRPARGLVRPAAPPRGGFSSRSAWWWASPSRRCWCCRPITPPRRRSSSTPTGSRSPRDDLNPPSQTQRREPPAGRQRDAGALVRRRPAQGGGPIRPRERPRVRRPHGSRIARPRRLDRPRRRGPTPRPIPSSPRCGACASASGCSGWSAASCCRCR